MVGVWGLKSLKMLHFSPSCNFSNNRAVAELPNLHT